MTGFDWGINFVLECLAIFFKGLFGGFLSVGFLFCLAYGVVYFAKWNQSIRKQVGVKK